MNILIEAAKQPPFLISHFLFAYRKILSCNFYFHKQAFAEKTDL